MYPRGTCLHRIWKNIFLTFELSFEKENRPSPEQLLDLYIRRRGSRNEKVRSLRCVLGFQWENLSFRVSMGPWVRVSVSISKKQPKTARRFELGKLSFSYILSAFRRRWEKGEILQWKNGEKCIFGQLASAKYDFSSYFLIPWECICLQWSPICPVWNIFFCMAYAGKLPENAGSDKNGDKIYHSLGIRLETNKGIETWHGPSFW